MSKAVDEFVEQMENLVADEYGDFKRKAGNYLNRLEEMLQSPSRSKISKIRQYLVFQPIYEMEEARQRAIEDAIDLANGCTS